MKILSWNVNGLRAAYKKGFRDFLLNTDADIIGIQEMKAMKEQLPEDLVNIDGFYNYFNSAERKGYSGTALFSKVKPNKVEFGEFSDEGRTIIAHYDDFVLFNVYFPNGGMGNKRVPFKMNFYENFLKFIDKLKSEGKNIIVMGDVNTAHTEIDLARPKQNVKNTGFLPEEREWIDKLIEHGYRDSFRIFNKNPEQYTFWNMKTRARDRNVGWRLDYFFVSENVKVKSCSILKDVMNSDHCPIELELE